VRAGLKTPPTLKMERQSTLFKWSIVIMHMINTTVTYSNKAVKNIMLSILYSSSLPNFYCFASSLSFTHCISYCVQSRLLVKSLWPRKVELTWINMRNKCETTENYAWIDDFSIPQRSIPYKNVWYPMQKSPSCKKTWLNKVRKMNV